MHKVRSYRAIVEYAPVVLIWISILVFFLAKYEDLFLPFYWDALGVYGPGILHMVDNGIGFLPSALPPELSRGHPLLFYYLFASYVTVFKFSLFKIHLLAFSISIGLVLSVRYIGSQFFNKWIALLSSVALMLIPNFFSISAMILPEIIIALSVLFGLYFCYKKQWLRYFIVCAIGILTKESAIVIPVASAFFVLLFSQYRTFKNLLFSLSPLLVFAGFLIIQKIQNGWYLFPWHVQLMSYDFIRIKTTFYTCVNMLFIAQGRTLLTIFIASGLIPYLINFKKNNCNRIHPFICLAFIFSAGFVCFSALNIYMDRYLLSILPLLVLIFGFSLKAWIKFSGKKYWIPALVALLFAIYPLTKYGQDEFKFDQDINFRDVVSVQMSATKYIEDRVVENEEVYANFPLYFGLKDVRYGYLSSRDSLDVYSVIKDSMRWIAVMEPSPVSIQSLNLDTSKIDKVFERGCAKAVVFKMR